MPNMRILKCDGYIIIYAVIDSEGERLKTLVVLISRHVDNEKITSRESIEG